MQPWVFGAMVVFVGFVLTLQLMTYWRARREVGRAAAGHLVAADTSQSD